MSGCIAISGEMPSGGGWIGGSEGGGLPLLPKHYMQ